MAKWKEIEIKWNAQRVKRSDFNLALRRHLRGKKWKLVTIAGFDYYHINGPFVLRHRHGSKTNELTVKARTSKRSTTVRKEVNVTLPPSVSPMLIREMMSELGFNKILPIYKDCDIYFVQDGDFVVDIVWYRASCDGDRRMDLIEVEIHEAPIKVSIDMLNKWKKFLNESFGLTDSDIINDSLYEIYSGKRYRVSKS